MTDTERDAMLIRVDERVNVLHTEMIAVKAGLADLSSAATGARAGLLVLFALGGLVTWLLTTTNVIKSIWPWG